MRILFFCLLSLFFATLPTLAQPKPFKVGPQVFDFSDPKGTNAVSITIDSPLEPITGVADGISGSATFDPDAPRATTGTISVAVSSMRFPNEGYTQTARFYALDENKHPQVTCVLKKIKSGKVVSQTAEQSVYQGQVEVDFTCKGITKALTVPLKVTYLRGIANQRGPDFAGDVINVRCDFTVKRSEFGIAAEAVPNLVSEEVGVRVSVVGIANTKQQNAKKQAATAPADIPIAIEGKRYTLAERMAFHQVPACTVTLIKDGKVAWTLKRGKNSSGQPVTDTTLFPIGSLGQPLVAAATLRAASQGQIKLDQDINSYLKSWKVPQSPLLPAGKSVTIRHLLENRSGFTYHKYAGYEPTQPIPTLLQVLKGEKPAVTPGATLATEPGSTFHLAMENYSVLQQIAEDISGTSFDSVMQDLLFTPLGMRSSRFLPCPTATMTVPLGHDETGKPLPGGWRVYPEIAASGMWTTSAELAEAMAELLRCMKGTGSYLKQEEAQLLIQAVTKDGTDDNRQAIGFGLSSQNGKTILFRGGNPEGYYCQLYANPQTASACIVLTNRNLCWKLTNEIMAAVDWK